MRLYLIRHGRQCSQLCNVNVDLAEEGFRQAELLGKRLAGEKIEAVYSSHLLRAVQTAETANRYWNAEHIIKEELREISFGEMEGMCDEDIAVKFAAFKKEQETMETDLPYPGGECAGDVIRRAMPVFLEMAESGYQKIAVVTHGGVIRSMLSAFLGMEPARYRILGKTLENCSITEVVYQPDNQCFTVERFNDYAHLEPYPELLRSSWVSAEN